MRNYHNMQCVGEFLDLFGSNRGICVNEAYLFVTRLEDPNAIYIVSWGLSKIVYPTE